jgi:hypothetical protein
MLAALRHLEAAVPSWLPRLSAMHKIIQEQPAGEQGYVLKLLNMYLQWFMSGVTQPMQVTSIATGPTSSGSSSSSRRTVFMVCPGGNKVSLYQARMTALSSCLGLMYWFLAAYSDGVQDGKVPAAAIRTQLLDQDTGELPCSAASKYSLFCSVPMHLLCMSIHACPHTLQLDDHAQQHPMLRHS